MSEQCKIEKDVKSKQMIMASPTHNPA